MATYSWTLPVSNNQSASAIQGQIATLLGKDIRFQNDYGVTGAGDYVLLEGEEALRQAVYRRLLTRPGEYRVRPEYGVGVLDFIKKRNTQSTLDELRQRIVDQLSLDDRIADVGELVIERITDGIKVGVTVQIAGRTLKFEPFNFRDSATVGTI